MPLFIFPEGGRTEDGRVQSFMRGPAYIAIRARIPLIPMALVGTYELLPIHTHHFQPRPVKLVIGQAIDPAGYSIRQADELTARLCHEITRLYELHCLRHGSSCRVGNTRSLSCDRGKRTFMNAQMPRIAIPEPTSGDSAYNQRSLPQYMRAVQAAGGEPVAIPLLGSAREQEDAIHSCSAVLLPGSPADMDPAHYGEQAIAACAAKDEAREFVDRLLLDDAFAHGKPVLGICFGLQSLNVYRGGSLIQDLPHPAAGATPNEQVVNHQPGREVQEAHFVKITPGTQLSRAILVAEDESTPLLAVNSSHHQAVGRPASDLIVAATSTQDGVIEALEGPATGQFVVAVQWHPERSYDYSAASRELFATFVGAARDWKEKS